MNDEKNASISATKQTNGTLKGAHTHHSHQDSDSQPQTLSSLELELLLSQSNKQITPLTLQPAPLTFSLPPPPTVIEKPLNHLTASSLRLSGVVGTAFVPRREGHKVSIHIPLDFFFFAYMWKSSFIQERDRPGLDSCHLRITPVSIEDSCPQMSLGVCIVVDRGWRKVVFEGRS